MKFHGKNLLSTKGINFIKNFQNNNTANFLITDNFIINSFNSLMANSFFGTPYYFQMKKQM